MRWGHGDQPTGMPLLRGAGDSAAMKTECPSCMAQEFIIKLLTDQIKRMWIVIEDHEFDNRFEKDINKGIIRARSK
jgi:hypothetical protein